MLIHKTIFSQKFKPITVLMIAHRLDHIMEFDYVLVMKDGEIIEYDTPQKLVANQASAFYTMAKEARVI